MVSEIAALSCPKKLANPDAAIGTERRSSAGKIGLPSLSSLLKFLKLSAAADQIARHSRQARNLNATSSCGSQSNLSMRRDLGENSILGFLFQYPEKLVVRALVVLVKETKCLLFNL